VKSVLHCLQNSVTLRPITRSNLYGTDRGVDVDAYGILRMTKVSNTGAIAHLGQHHLRTAGYTAKSNPDIDPNRTALNYRLDDCAGRTLSERIDARIAAGLTAKNQDGTTKKIRADAVKMVDIICATSGEFMAGLTADRQREYFKECLEWVKGHFGADNIVSAVVHMDETTPHLHICAVPITAKGRLSAKEFMGSRKQLRYIQDRYWEGVSKNWGLERGERVELTGRKHLNVAEYKASTDGLRQEIALERASLEAASKAEMDGLRRKVEQERAGLEQEAEKRRIDVLAKIKVLEDRVKLTDKEILEWIDKVKEETEIESRKPKGAKFFDKPVDMAVLPVERLNEVLQVLESKIYADLEKQDKIKNLTAAADRKDGIIQEYNKNWIPKDQLKAAGLTPERLTEMAQARQQQQKQKESTKEKTPSRSITD